MENRFIDNGDTVTDQKTGLTWMKEDDGERRTLEEAKAYCEQVGEGWRLPTIDELQTIIDRSKYRPAIDPVFTNTKSSWYWSSTPYAVNSSGAWVVYFNFGYVDWDGVSSSGFVRPVRQDSSVI